MKIKFALACLIGLSFGISGTAAHAFNISFNTYDHNRDGRWDRREYYDACRDWHRHNDHHYYPRRVIYKRFDTYDRDRNGYLDEHEMRDINAW